MDNLNHVCRLLRKLGITVPWNANDVFDKDPSAYRRVIVLSLSQLFQLCHYSGLTMHKKNIVFEEPVKQKSEIILDEKDTDLHSEMLKEEEHVENVGDSLSNNGSDAYFVKLDSESANNFEALSDDHRTMDCITVHRNILFEKDVDEEFSAPLANSVSLDDNGQLSKDIGDNVFTR